VLTPKVKWSGVVGDFRKALACLPGLRQVDLWNWAQYNPLVPRSGRQRVPTIYTARDVLLLATMQTLHAQHVQLNKTQHLWPKIELALAAHGASAPDALLYAALSCGHIIGRLVRLGDPTTWWLDERGAPLAFGVLPLHHLIDTVAERIAAVVPELVV
jgi:hypothetical protein